MSSLHTYISQKVNTIRTATYGNSIRAAIADAIVFIDTLITNSGSKNTFVVCTQAEYDDLIDEDKTATAYFIVEDTSSSS